MSKLIILLCSALSAFGSEASKEAGDLTSAMLEDTPAAPLLGPVPSTTLDNVPEFFLRHHHYADKQESLIQKP